MYISINNLNIFYQKYGNGGQVILILPGWGNNRETFNYLIEVLKDYFTIYILDYPGFGNSSMINSDLTIYDYTEIIYKFIKKLKIFNPILIGHSFGGRIISLLTTTYKLKIKKILLIDVAGIKRKNLKLSLKTKLYKLLKRLGNLLPINLKTKYLEYLFNKFSSNDYKELDKRLLKTFQNVVLEDLTKYYSRINIETLILWGELDIVTPLKDAYKINRLIKSSYLIIIPNTRHFPYLENKYLTTNIILEYLKKDII